MHESKLAKIIKRTGGADHMHLIIEQVQAKQGQLYTTLLELSNDVKPSPLPAAVPTLPMVLEMQDSGKCCHPQDEVNDLYRQARQQGAELRALRHEARRHASVVDTGATKLAKLIKGAST